MKILLLCDRFPYPLTNGQNLRIYHLVRQLGRRHAFDLLCYGDGDAPAEIRPLFARIEVFPRPPGVASTGVARWLDAFRVDSFIPASEPVRRHLGEACIARDYDVIWVSGWDMIVNLPQRFPVPVLADAVDDGVLEHWRRMRRTEGLFEKARALKWVAMNARFERRYFGAAQAALFVSELDASVFRRISPRTPTHVVHNGVDCEYFRPLATERRPLNLVFEGNMGFAPNVDAARYFVREVMPALRRARAVTLTLVGNNPAPEVRALACEDVEVTGFVDDVRPYIDRAAMFVCPMRIGAGIKNKILQAWAMGKAVVATRQAVGGLAYRDGQNILIADGTAALADGILRLLDDPDLSERIGAEGRRTVLASYTWDKKAAELEKVLIGTAGRRP